MIKLKYTLIFIMIFAFSSKTEALDIQYGALKGYKGNDVLIEYYGIEKKNNYICNVLNFKCTTTKKTTLGVTSTTTLKKSIKNEIQEKGGGHTTLSRSGKWLAYYVPAYEPENVKTYIIKNTKDNKNYSISGGVSFWDLIKEQHKIFEFSPDDKTLIYLDDKDDAMSMYKVNINSLKNSKIESTKIKTTGYIIANFIYTDSQSLYYIANTKENPYRWSLYRLDMTTGIDKVLETDVSYLDKITKVGSNLIFVRQQSKGYGPEAYNVITKKLGFFKVPNIDTKKSTTNEQFVKVGNSNAVIMTPLSFDPQKTYPVLIWLHGGPLRQTSYGYHPYHSYGLYDSILKLLQKNNVIVVKLDYRGSFGVGRNYSESIKGNVGKGDIDDVMEAVAYVNNQYKISDVYLSGNSYGGYMSLRAIAEYPKTFKGIFSINGVTDWESLLVRMKTSIFNTHFSGLPNDENRNLYDKASIINKIKKLGKQRIEIIQGEADRTIPLWQATLLADKLEKANKNVNLVTYKGEDHVFKYKKNISNLCTRLFELMEIPADKECTD